MTAEDENQAPSAPVTLPPEPATIPTEAGAHTEELPTVEPHEDNPEIAEVEPATPLSRADRMKAYIREVLDREPFRGEHIHRLDFLAVMDALIDGPPDA